MNVSLQQYFAACLPLVLQVGRFGTYEVTGPYCKNSHNAARSQVCSKPENQNPLRFLGTFDDQAWASLYRMSEPTFVLVAGHDPGPARNLGI